MIHTWSGRSSLAAFLALLLLAPALAAGEQPGILWESTSQPVMQGMPMQMPAQTQRHCAARQWTKPPAAQDRNCTSSNFRTAGSKATWTVQCTGEMPMTGAGEITFEGTDSYRGQLELSSDAMKMTVKLSGKKVGGCDDPQ